MKDSISVFEAKSICQTSLDLMNRMFLEMSDGSDPDLKDIETVRILLQKVATSKWVHDYY